MARKIIPKRLRKLPVKRKKTKSLFAKSKATEASYARVLKSIASEVGKLVEGFGGPKIEPSKVPALQEALRKYADLITPWASSKAETMVLSQNNQDRRAWKKASEHLSAGVREAINSVPVGGRMKELLADQVKLIRSLPTKAGERVQHLVLENLDQSRRHEEIAKEISRSGEVSKARAKTIARTEVARVASVLTQSRAEFIGSAGYIWRTAHDGDVRPSHRKMEGVYVAWDDPPTLDNLTGHAGQLPNCRCFPEPVIPSELFDD